MMTTLPTMEIDQTDGTTALTLQCLDLEPMVADEDLGDGDLVHSSARALPMRPEALQPPPVSG